MKIKEFLNTYGVDTKNNFQLIKYAKDLKIKPFYCCMRDELRQLPKTLPIYIIANYQTSNETGSHWVSMYKDVSTSFYFDPYGIEAIKEAKDFLGEGYYNTGKIQKEGTTMCGTLSLYILYKLSKGYNFFDIVLELYDEFP